jgi:hypothetical protein
VEEPTQAVRDYGFGQSDCQVGMKEGVAEVTRRADDLGYDVLTDAIRLD